MATFIPLQPVYQNNILSTTRNGHHYLIKMDCKSTAKVNGIYQLQGQDMPRFLEEAGFIIMNNNDKYKSFSFNIGELILGGESIIAFVAT